MIISAVLHNSLHHHDVVVQTNDDKKSISIQPKINGYGSSINGGELLMLSLATCFCNDIYREAVKRNIIVDKIEVMVTGNFGAEGEPGTNFKYKVNVESKADDAIIEDMINYVDSIAEIHNTLRKGLPVTLENNE